MENEKKSDNFLAISILTAGILISGSIIYMVGAKSAPAPAPAVVTGGNQQPTATVGPADLAIGGRDVILGNPNAPVTLIEYGDYQCPFCGKFFSQVDLKLRDEYVKQGSVKMVFRNLSFLGPESDAAAAAAECAKDQKQFWAYHDALYTAEIADSKENNGNLTRTLFIKLASDLKMDTTAFTSCLDSQKYTDEITKDTASARSVGVDSTPTVFINGQRFTGALPYSQFKAAIDTALKVK